MFFLCKVIIIDWFIYGSILFWPVDFGDSSLLCLYLYSV